MNLKKLFGIGNLNKGQQTSARLWATRAPRVTLTPLHAICLTIQGGPHNGQQISIINLSTSGIGFRAPTSDWPTEGNSFQGSLKLGTETVPAAVKVVRMHAGFIGAIFSSPAPQLIRAINEYLRLEIAASDMTRVPLEMLEKESDGTPYWYNGRNNCELYFVVKDKEVLRFHFSFFANYVEGGLDQPLKFGQIVEESEKEKPGHKSSSLIQWGAPWDENLFTAAHRMLAQLMSIEDAHRDKLRDFLYKAEKETRS